MMNVKKYISVLMLFFLPVMTAFSADYNMWVGESGSYEMSGTGYNNFRINHVNCAQPSVSCNVVGWKVKWTVDQYFSGTATIVVEYSYQVTSRDTYKNGQLTLTVSCKDNQITIIPSSLTLRPGQSYDLEYSFQNRQYVRSPKLHWYTNDREGKIITVDNTGWVKAIGPGKAIVYLDHDQGSNDGICNITVEDVKPNSVSLPSTLALEVNQSERLTPQLNPSDASATYTWWSDNSSIASVNDGYVTGVGIGSTTVHVRTDNYKEASCYVTVNKPSFKVSSTTPSNSATNVSVTTKPSVVFTSQLKWASGKTGSEVTLTNIDKSTKVEGSASLSGNSLRFSPQKVLDAQTRYRLTIPANTLVDVYGTKYESAYTLNFKTGDKEKLTLTMSPDDEWVSEGTKVAITSNVSSAIIYYTTNGSTPSSSSMRYTSPITINKNTTIKAFGICDGYYNSDVVTKNYKIPILKISNTAPKEGAEAGREVRPSVTYNCIIRESSNFDKIALIHNDSKIGSDFFIHDNQLVCVPQSQLLGGSYKFYIPANAIMTEDSEPNTQYSTTFNVVAPPIYPVMGSSDFYYSGLLKSDGTLWTWGMFRINGDPVTSTSVPEKRAEDVIDFSIGTHHIGIVKSDHSLWMMGGNNYGQFGNGKTSSSPNSFIKVLDGIKEVFCGNSVTYMIKEDNSLWSCGAQGLDLIGDGSGNNRSTPVKILDDVCFVSPGNSMCVAAITFSGKLYLWGSSSVVLSKTPVQVADNVTYACAVGASVYYIKSDNTLWYNKEEWDDYNHKYKWQPYKVMNNVKKIISGAYTILVLKTDGKLYGWGSNSKGLLCTSSTNYVEESSPVLIMDSVLDFWLPQDWQYAVCATAIKKDLSVWTWGSNGSDPWGKRYVTLGYDAEDGIHAPYKIIDIPSNAKSLANLDIEESNIHIIKGQKYAFRPVLSPNNAIYSIPVWTSNNPTVAEVDNRGIVTAKSAGSAIITVTVDDKKAQCTVIVNDVSPSGIQNIERDTHSDNRIFDLYGRQLDKPRKGINIIGGRKVLVK